MTHAAYIKSPAWKKLSKAVKERDDNQCVRCGAKSALHGHHWRYPDDFADDSADNVVTLCANCHGTLHLKHTCSSAEEAISLLHNDIDQSSLRLQAEAHLAGAKNSRAHSVTEMTRLFEAISTNGTATIKLSIGDNRLTPGVAMGLSSGLAILVAAFNLKVVGE